MDKVVSEGETNTDEKVETADKVETEGGETEPTADGKDKSGEGAGDKPGDGQGDKGAKGKDGDGKAAAAKDGKADAADNVEWPEDGFPDDWRQRTLKQLGLTGDALKKAEDKAKRISSPAELLRSVLSADSKIQETAAALKDRVKLPTGKGDKPEDIAAFRKAAGIPEKAEAYKVPDPPKELGERSDLDKAIISEALKEFHHAHFSQAQVTAAIAAFDKAQAEMMKTVEVSLTKVNDTAEEDLRAHFGRNYKAEVELTNRWLRAELSPFMAKDELAAFLNEQEPGKPRRGNNPAFVKWANKQARLAADDGDLPASEGTDAVDPQKRFDEIMALSHSSKLADQEKYKTPALQKELEQLAAALNRRKK